MVLFRTSNITLKYIFHRKSLTLSPPPLSTLSGKREKKKKSFGRTVSGFRFFRSQFRCPTSRLWGCEYVSLSHLPTFWGVASVCSSRLCIVQFIGTVLCDRSFVLTRRVTRAINWGSFVFGSDGCLKSSALSNQFSQNQRRAVN